MEFVEIVGLADLNAEAPGVQLASKHGVRTTTNFIELLRGDQPVDLVIEVTGVKQVRQDLLSEMRDSGNRHTIIVRELIAILMMSLSSGQLVQMKHADMEY